SPGRALAFSRHLADTGANPLIGGLLPMIFTDPAVATVFAAYEAHAAADRARLAPTDRADIPRDALLLPIGPEVGALLHALVLGRRPARILELGTSYGYSTLFLADAARQ